MEELVKAKEGQSFNNISAVIQYSLKNGATLLWMGDLETSFLKKIGYCSALAKAKLTGVPSIASCNESRML